MNPLITNVLVAASVVPSPTVEVLLDTPRIEYNTSISSLDGSFLTTFSADDWSTSTLHVGTGPDAELSPLLPDWPGSSGDGQFSPDGRRVYFVSEYVDANGQGTGSNDIWVTEKRHDDWTTPVCLPAPVNTDADEFYPMPVADGSLYFMRDADLFVARWTGDAFAEPERLPATVNHPRAFDADGYVAPDESFLIFASRGRADGLGVTDLYVSFRDGDGWTEAVNLGPGVNSPGVDGSPFVTPDRAMLYLTSNRGSPDPTRFDGHLDLYRVPLDLDAYRVR